MLNNAIITNQSELKNILKESIAELFNEYLEKIIGQKDEQLLSIEQTAQFFNTTKQTIANWRKKGFLEGIRIGGRVYFLKSELMAIVTHNKISNFRRTKTHGK